jgi:hypothetical protein
MFYNKIVLRIKGTVFGLLPRGLPRKHVGDVIAREYEDWLIKYSNEVLQSCVESLGENLQATRAKAFPHIPFAMPRKDRSSAWQPGDMS